ncbi:hypothetical protein AGMMS50249_7960 [candidate division SR1 bacterium]|nr:hypothetical protein AGMMS50249_7960 [candidate division SR1 bacterium]
MNTYIPEELIEQIETLKENNDFKSALKLVNHILTRDPSNEEALLQIADIHYRQQDVDKADKAMDFFNSQKKDDPLGLYIKGLLEMEKNHREEARNILKKSLELVDGDNHEIRRCYGLCEYRYGNREKGITHLQLAFQGNSKDVEVVYNLIQVFMLEKYYEKAETMIEYFFEHRDELETVEKELDWYEKKVKLFNKCIELEKKQGRK